MSRFVMVVLSILFSLFTLILESEVYATPMLAAPNEGQPTCESDTRLVREAGYDPCSGERDISMERDATEVAPYDEIADRAGRTQVAVGVPEFVEKVSSQYYNPKPWEYAIFKRR